MTILKSPTKEVPVAKAPAPSYKLLRNQRIINSKGAPILCKEALVYPQTPEEVELCKYMVSKGILEQNDSTQ